MPSPLSSRNPDIDTLGKNKARLILLNKADLADPAANQAWTGYFEKKGYTVVRIDARRKADLKPIQAAVMTACKEKIERDRRRGIKNRPVRAMVVGIPNVGKSTFINSYAGRACAKTGNKPGVTRGNQWIRLNKEVELLDTPGILWPKFEDPQVGIRLAVLGSVKDDILNSDELAVELLKRLRAAYPEALSERYGEAVLAGSEAEALMEIARARNCILKGGEPDYSRAAKLLIDDFRGGRLGRITRSFRNRTIRHEKKRERLRGRQRDPGDAPEAGRNAG